VRERRDRRGKNERQNKGRRKAEERQERGRREAGRDNAKKAKVRQRREREERQVPQCILRICHGPRFIFVHAAIVESGGTETQEGNINFIEQQYAEGRRCKVQGNRNRTIRIEGRPRYGLSNEEEEMLARTMQAC
jgi:hypothetical protein